MYKLICYHHTSGHLQAPPHNIVGPGTTRARTTHRASAPLIHAQPAPLGRHQMARTTARWPATRGAHRYAKQGAHTLAPLTRGTERGHQLKTPDLNSFVTHTWEDGSPRWLGSISCTTLEQQHCCL